MFSGMSSLSGIDMNLPDIEVSSHSIHGYLLWLNPLKLLVITSNDFDLSRTEMISPGFTENEGMLHISPLTII